MEDGDLLKRQSLTQATPAITSLEVTHICKISMVIAVKNTSNFFGCPQRPQNIVPSKWPCTHTVI